MNYSELDQEWAFLENEHTSGLLTKELSKVAGRQVRIGVDDDKTLYVLVEQEPGTEETDSLEIMDGLRIRSERRVIEDVDGNHFIVSCESDYRPIFPPFTVDFMAELKEHDPRVAFHNAHAKSKEYWKGRRPPLSAEQQKGLIGELVILNELAVRSSFEDMLEKWTGPLDMLHDFESGRIDIEVKATLRDPPIVRISDIEQLAPLDSKELLLTVVQLSRQKSGDSLPDMINITRDSIKEQKQRAEGFEELLKTVGYLDKHQLYYTSKYKVSNILFCPIEVDTPILDPGLLGVIPDTVSDIAYSLHISGLKRYSPTDNDWNDLRTKILDLEE